jgi:hypothetical protein
LIPDQPHANLALKDLQYFPVDISLKKPYVLLETFYCLRATLGRSEKEGSFFRRVVRPRGSKSRNDVIHLEQRLQPPANSKLRNADLIHENFDARVQALRDRIVE